MDLKFEKNTFNKRIKTMLGVDFRRMFTAPLFYIMLGISFVIPILVIVMTTMMDGSVSVDPNTGAETVIEGFKNVWQIIGIKTGDNSSMSMDITSMCNINLMYFIIAVLVCIFVADDFRSGYAKNLFTVRADRKEYVVSKSVVCFVSGASMIFAFFVGAMLGGAMMSLPFDLNGVTAGNILMCLLSKMFIVGIFTSIYVFAGVVAKQKLWLSILLSLGIGMLFFTMVPMITPLNSGLVNVILCLIGTGLFGTGIGIGSYYILKKVSII